MKGYIKKDSRTILNHLLRIIKRGLIVLYSKNELPDEYLDDVVIRYLAIIYFELPKEFQPDRVDIGVRITSSNTEQAIERFLSIYTPIQYMRNFACTAVMHKRVPNTCKIIFHDIESATAAMLLIMARLLSKSSNHDFFEAWKSWLGSTDEPAQLKIRMNNLVKRLRTLIN